MLVPGHNTDKLPWTLALCSASWTLWYLSWHSSSLKPPVLTQVVPPPLTIPPRPDPSPHKSVDSSIGHPSTPAWASGEGE
ncbi:hypothetical protein Pcinc_044100 [Petrolisthes cinctipes]|uniref:Uncharacterized protein n=1 Tax=Petrolisthes cinctipes TaxID=88211 RepID=A0AAE1EEQ7_PETCI|nr:hypothetical protein Pcinc_044100 [Petrolisthes cinctipes]